MTKEQIIATAVESFDLGPEDQDAVLRFGMRLQDMEDAERKAADSLELGEGLLRSSTIIVRDLAGQERRRVPADAP